MVIKTLVIYYSLDGNTEFVARAIADKKGADLFRIETINDYPSDFSRYIIGGFQALFKIIVKLKPVKINFDEYEEIFIGTPVWAGSLTPPIRSFLEENPVQGKRVTLFCTYDGNSGWALKQLGKMLRGNDIIKCLDFREPLKNKEEVSSRVEEAVNANNKINKGV
ncbi:MAG: hypothetical protein PWR10_1135 [Halanaerobiales bacterium]|nr:hypothetical protein [Halanaerobiales bacterium]